MTNYLETLRERLVRVQIETYKTLKNKVIDDKNKLLFGYLTTEEALENFNISKEEIEMVMPNPLMKKYIININPTSDIIIEVLYGVSSHDYIIFFPKL